MDKEIIFLSGFGVKVMVSKMFLTGLKVFLDISEALTLFQDLGQMDFYETDSNSSIQKFNLRT